MPSEVSSTIGGWRARLSPPPPDSREGVVLVAAGSLALVYVLLFVAQYDTMVRLAFSVTTLSLILSVVSAFALGVMLGSDISTFQRLELELARTVLAYVGSGTPPPSEAPLAGVWRAHVAAAEEARRMGRAHAYALGLFASAGLLSLGAALLSGLGTVTGTRDVSGLGMFVEWFAFAFLVAGAAAVVASVGYSAPVPFFENVAPRRWRRNAGRQQAVDGAVSEIAWLSEYSRGARAARASPSGPALIPGWQE